VLQDAVNNLGALQVTASGDSVVLQTQYNKQAKPLQQHQLDHLSIGLGKAASAILSICLLHQFCRHQFFISGKGNTIRYLYG